MRTGGGHFEHLHIELQVKAKLVIEGFDEQCSLLVMACHLSLNY